MKEIVKKGIKFINDLFLFIGFLINTLLIQRERTKVNYKLGKISVLANGPSLKEDLPEILNYKDNESDYIVMNYFAFDEAFFSIKPKYYCFADPMFFSATHRLEEAKKLFKILNEQVDWELVIIIPHYFKEDFFSFNDIYNKNITVKLVNATSYIGFEKFRNFFYEKGLASPELLSVVILAIYFGIISRYATINLFGVDHTFFNGLTINKNNDLCACYSHFNTTEENVVPLIRIENGENWKIEDYIIHHGGIFRSHRYLNSLAKCLNVRVVNCTRNSLIDSYVRR